MRTIAIVNQKGGVGKTTTTVNLAHALALKGYRVTAIDLDPQGHLGASFGIQQRGMATGIDRVLLDEQSIEEQIIVVRDGLQFIPSGNGLGRMEQLVNGGAKRGMYLRNALSGKFKDQDFILIDCPPASSLLLVNALFCAGEVLVPVAGDYLSLQGLSYLIATFKNFESKLKHEFNEWIVLTRYHKQRRLPDEIMQKLKQYFPQRVLRTRIRESAPLAECPGFGKTIFEYRNRSSGADDYRALARELSMKRVA